MRMGTFEPLEAEAAAARKSRLAVGEWRRGEALEARKLVGKTGTLRSWSRPRRWRKIRVDRMSGLGHSKAGSWHSHAECRLCEHLTHVQTMPCGQKGKASTVRNHHEIRVT
jgi:hypothetical protein